MGHIPEPGIPLAVSGAWCEWSEWTVCSQPCSGQMRTRSRVCACPTPRHGGAPCSEESAQHQKEACPSPATCPGVVSPPSPCPLPRASKNLGAPELDVSACTVDAAWSPWELWAPCDVCLGQSQRSRTCSQPPTSDGGRPCMGAHVQSRPCQDNATQCTGKHVGTAWKGPRQARGCRLCPLNLHPCPSLPRTVPRLLSCGFKQGDRSRQVHGR